MHLLPNHDYFGGRYVLLPPKFNRLAFILGNLAVIDPL